MWEVDSSGIHLIEKTMSLEKYKPWMMGPNQGFWYFEEKKSKFCGIFRGKFAENRPISRGKSQNSRKNRPISRGFRGRKVKIRRKIVRFRGILAEKSQISKDFQGANS